MQTTANENLKPKVRPWQFVVRWLAGFLLGLVGGWLWLVVITGVHLAIWYQAKVLGAPDPTQADLGHKLYELQMGNIEQWGFVCALGLYMLGAAYLIKGWIF